MSTMYFFYSDLSGFCAHLLLRLVVVTLSRTFWWLLVFFLAFSLGDVELPYDFASWLLFLSIMNSPRYCVCCLWHYLFCLTISLLPLNSYCSYSVWISILYALFPWLLQCLLVPNFSFSKLIIKFSRNLFHDKGEHLFDSGFMLIHYFQADFCWQYWTFPPFYD